VTIQGLIASLQTSSTSNYETLEQTLNSALTVIRKDIEPIYPAIQDQTVHIKSVRSHAEDHVRNEGLDDQIHRMEQLQLSLENMASSHHCRGCNCRMGFDSVQSSPEKIRRPPSTYGSDATGISPHPYGQQSFDGSIGRDRGKGYVNSPARPYDVDLTEEGPENIVVHPPGHKDEIQPVCSSLITLKFTNDIFCRSNSLLPEVLAAVV
jgi:hypothetical protein